MILEHIAQTIVDQTNQIIDHPIIITDDKGHIVGSTDRSRIGSLHIASIDILKQKKAVSYEWEDVKSLDNVLPGVATPIFLNDQAIGVLGIAGSPDIVKKYAQLVKSHVELMFHESFKKETVVLEAKTLDRFVQFLLYANSSENSDHMLQYAKMLGYDLDLDRICILIEIQSFDRTSFPYFQQQLLDQVKHLFVDHQQDMLSLLSFEQIIVLKCAQPGESDKLLNKMAHSAQKLGQLLDESYHLRAAVAAGNRSSGASGIRESYHHALRTLNIGKKLPSPRQMYLYNDWDITLELVPQELTPYIRNKLAGQLHLFLHHNNYAVLSHTFLTYCRCNMNLSETARSLYIHRNSLIYRLDKIAELAALDISQFENCLLLYLAIQSYSGE